MKEQQAQREEQVEEVWSSSKAEEDPVYSSGEEEEDPGSSDGYGSEEEEEDKDLPPASAHRLVTRLRPRNRFLGLSGRPTGPRDPGLEVAPRSDPRVRGRSRSR